MFEFFKSSAKPQETPNPAVDRIKEWEQLKVRMPEMRKELIEPYDDERLEAIAEKLYELHNEAVNKAFYRQNIDALIDEEKRLIAEHGQELAKYFIEKKRRLREAKIWPSDRDKLVAISLGSNKLLPKDFL